MCPDGLYLDDSNSCQSCVQNCPTCSDSAEICTSCGNNMYLTMDNTCVCNLGFYKDQGGNCL